jgi:hypothetical protein
MYVYVLEESLYNCHFVHHKFYTECLGRDSGTRMAMCRQGWPCYCTVRDGILLHSMIDCQY